jgi:hypothetical protein
MRMWLPRVDFHSNRGIREDLWGDTSVSCSRAGSNILEYGRLSELSIDLEFFRNVYPNDLQNWGSILTGTGDGSVVAYH